jgi:hypothetical protein
MRLPTAHNKSAAAVTAMAMRRLLPAASVRDA